MSKYHKTISTNADGQSDVYDVLRAFNVACPATQHAIKKLLMPGMRGDKSRQQDLCEARESIDRAIELADKGDPDQPVMDRRASQRAAISKMTEGRDAAGED